jgi:hypothetical protein
MPLSRLNELQGLSNGFSIIVKSGCRRTRLDLDHFMKSFVSKELEYFKYEFENNIIGRVNKSSPLENLESLGKKVNAFRTQASTLLKSSDLFKNGPNFFSQTRSFHYLSKKQSHVFVNEIYLFNQNYYYTTVKVTNVKSENTNAEKPSKGISLKKTEYKVFLFLLFLFYVNYSF